MAADVWEGGEAPCPLGSELVATLDLKELVEVWCAVQQTVWGLGIG